MPDRPNILFLLTDQQRRDSMRCYGNDWIETPALNALAEQSFVFENAYVTQPVCTPARSSILTGLYPHTNGLVRNNIALRPDTRAIAEMMPAGYRCAYYGKWHLGDDDTPQHGFVDWLSSEDPHGAGAGSGPRQASGYHAFLRENGVELPERYVPPGGDGAGSARAVAQANLPEELTQATFIGNETARFIRDHARDRDEPFLLFANFFEPHPPYSGPLNGLYDPAALPVGPGFLRHPDGASLLNRARSEFYMAGDHNPASVAGCDGHDLTTEAGWRALRAQYFGNVTLVDRAVGRILGALEESGLAEDTLVVFTSDHGEMAGDHGLLEKRAFYEEASRVPLLMRAPWLSREQRRVAGNIGQIDLVPTLLEMAGARLPEHLQGRSRAGVLRGEATLDGVDAFIQWNGRGDRDLGTPTINAMIALPRRTIVSPDRWKLSLCAIDPDTGARGDDGELFDLNADPFELVNLFDAPEHRDRAREMTARLREWQQETGDDVDLAGP